MVPRSSHAEFLRATDRSSPPELLATQDADRLPELPPIRYGRMAATPYTCFRGAALPIASDLATTPRTGFTVQTCAEQTERDQVELREAIDVGRVAATPGQ